MPLQSAWTDAELNTSILKLCDEFPRARMVDCSRALEHCRRTTPTGTPESLLAAMRASLRRNMDSPRSVYAEAGLIDRGPERALSHGSSLTA